VFSFKLDKEKIVHLSAKEYFSGTTKNICSKKRCSCQQKICNECGGSGFSLNGNNILLKVCMDCTGDGFTQNCSNCENGFKKTTITFGPQPKFEMSHPNLGTIKLKIEEPYFVKDSQLYCTFDILLKESLIGFHKIFKDPFDEAHDVITQGIIKSNDGYRIVTNTFSVILVFNIIYPKKLSKPVIEQLSKLNF
jgi:hypothetical protein